MEILLQGEHDRSPLFLAFVLPIFLTLSFKNRHHVPIGHWAMKSSDPWETTNKQTQNTHKKWGESCNCPRLYHERVLRPECRKRVPRWSPLDSRVEKTKLKVWRDQSSRSLQNRVLERVKLHGERIWKSAEDPLKYSGDYWSMYA